ncbi:MAG TPA: HD domain-containing protein [Firmicutes bacterium]|nr:HD domain-containing protein [Bacillota bacterium]
MSNNLEKQVKFLLEVDKMKNILRQTLKISDRSREDDAEHSWHFALMAFVLSEYASEGVDINRVIKMALVHDLVEIYAGDTYAYDIESNKSKAEREKASADKLFSILPEEQGREIRDLWEEFDAEQTPDACFAAAIDRLQPMLNNYYTDGQSWKSHKVASASVYKRMEPIRRASEELWRFAASLVDDAVKKEWLIDNGKEL